MPFQLDDYRLMGRSGLRVSPMALGTMTFGMGVGSWGSSDEDAARMVDLYIDRGGNFIDTANYYGNLGGSELLLGKTVKGRRDRLVISTKYSLTTAPGDPNAAGNHRKNMVRSLEDSLRRLGSDYIDVLYLHMWDFLTPIDEIMRGLDDLVRAGKVLYIGLSDTPAWEASRMQMMAELRGLTQFCALQISYSMIERTVEREMIPMAVATGMGVCPWSPLAGGILSGKYGRQDLPMAGGGFDLNSRKGVSLATGLLTPESLAIVETVAEVAHELGLEPAQIALAWLMHSPAVTSPVLGARTPAQLESNLGALEIELAPDQLARLDEASSVPPVFPMSLLKGPTEGYMFGGVKVRPRC